MKIQKIEQDINQITEDTQKILDEVNKYNGEEGILLVRKRKGNNSYYKRKDAQDINGVYLSKSKGKTIQNLEKKNYYELLKKVASENLKLYKKAEAAMAKAVEIKDVFFKIPQEKRHLIQPICPNDVDEEYAKKWVGNDWHNAVGKTKGTYKASNGIFVRSKSELIIAEKLIASGVPFYYEKPVTVDFVFVNYPDFLVLNKRTKKEYYWEHFGLISDPKYCANIQEKLETYARNNIVLGKNLIISMESAEHPLDNEYVDKMIEQYLK